MISVSVSLDTVLLLSVCLSVCVSNQIWSEFGRRLTFISWEFPFKENSVAAVCWLLVWWCSCCPSVVQTVSPPVQWSHDLLTSPISSPDLMVGKLKKYYFCHNSRLAAGQPEMDDIWPGGSFQWNIRMVIALSFFYFHHPHWGWGIVTPSSLNILPFSQFTSHFSFSVWLWGPGKGRVHIIISMSLLCHIACIKCALCWLCYLNKPPGSGAGSHELSPLIVCPSLKIFSTAVSQLMASCKIFFMAL